MKKQNQSNHSIGLRHLDSKLNGGIPAPVRSVPETSSVRSQRTRLCRCEPSNNHPAWVCKLIPWCGVAPHINRGEVGDDLTTAVNRILQMVGYHRYGEAAVRTYDRVVEMQNEIKCRRDNN